VLALLIPADKVLVARELSSSCEDTVRFELMPRDVAKRLADEFEKTLTD
jgi:hypothetical protein